jgi:hypothetical protein
MPVPSIHKVGSCFDDRNTFLHVVLGAVSMLRRYRHVLRADGGGERAAEDDELVYVALGLVSFSRSFMRHLAAMRSTTAEPEAVAAPARGPDAPPPADLRDLLR